MDNYKEKYEQALQRAKQFSEKPYLEDSKGIVEYIFPELAESEDERIRKALIEHFRWNTKQILNEFSNKKALAWLEKQGEPTDIPADAVLDGNKDGLIAETIRYKREKQGEQKPAENKGMNLAEEEMTPFQKKVFCIIDTTIEEEQGLKQVCDELLRLAHEEQKPAWSEEDEKMLHNTLSTIRYALSIPIDKENDPCLVGSSTISWLKSLKDRVHSKQEWSEEDKKLINDTCHLINTLASGYGEKVTEPITLSGTQMIASTKDRLRALVDNRPQNRWKPSDEQIEAIEKTLKYFQMINAFGETIDGLKELEKQLKKLREE